MAFHTVLEVGDAFLAMFAGNIRFVVLMTTVTRIGCIGARVTGGAGDVPTFTVIEREGMLAIEFSGRPGGGAVAGYAVGAELSRVFDRLGVT